MPRLTGPGGPARPDPRPRLRVEVLEERAIPSAAPAAAGEFRPMVVAGDPNGTEPANREDKDAPEKRIDPNTAASPYAGVGSLQVRARNGGFIGSGAVVGSRYVVTAAHVVDLNNDGKVTAADGTQGVYFLLNLGGATPVKIAVTRFTIHPDYNGFGNPAVNDDVAILTLARPVPAGVPVYGLPEADLAEGTVLTMVGYGRSGDPVNGYTTPASLTVKRVGQNSADAFYGQDDPGRPEANEVFRFDFDGPDGDGPLGGGTLGNLTETTYGSGDSGGPAFADGLVLSGINTFTQGSAPSFGSMGGGVNVFPYAWWIQAILRGQPVAALRMPSGRSAGGGGVDVGATPVRDHLSADGLAAVGAFTTGAPAWSAEESDEPAATLPTVPADEPRPGAELLISAPLPGDDLFDGDPFLAGDVLTALPSGEGLPVEE